jgi:hypothetical protein
MWPAEQIAIRDMDSFGDVPASKTVSKYVSKGVEKVLGRVVAV